MSLVPVPQEVSSLGLRVVWSQADEPAELNAVAVLNGLYELIQLHRQGLRALDDAEAERLRSAGNAELLQLSNTRLKVTGKALPLPQSPCTSCTRERKTVTQRRVCAWDVVGSYWADVISVF